MKQLRRWILISLVLSSLLSFLSAVRAAKAHPADEYLQEHTLYITPTALRMDWEITPGPLLVPVIWTGADTDQDGDVSQTEARVWVEATLAEVSLTLDGTSLPWQIEAITWPASLTTFQVGDENILVQLTVPWPDLLVTEYQLVLHNRAMEAVSIGWFYVKGEAGVQFPRPQQQNGRLQVELRTSTATPSPADVSLLTYWDTGMPSLPGTTEVAAAPAVAQEVVAPPGPESESTALLTDLIRSEQLSLNFFLIALGTATVLGALHALTPGHGKTVVAAYLVGARGTALHAVTLGSIVTLTHTGSVFLLGLLTLLASRYIVPTRLFPILELLSGLLIVGLGVHLLYQRWRAWRTGQSALHHHHHLPTQLTWRSLLTLGISGGLVPCPDAIAILLVAVVINRIVLGLSLIVAFSLGLALVLIAIGLAMVHSRRLFEKMDTFGRLAPAIPVVSAVVVLVLGLGLTWSALRGTGLLAPEPVEIAQAAKSPKNEETAVAVRPNFALDQSSILYLARTDASPQKQIFVSHLGDPTPRRLSQEPYGVTSFALSPDGQTIAYAALRDQGGSDLWAIEKDGTNRRQLLTCAERGCSKAVWSPDGQRLIYESGLSSLRWLNLTTGETGSLFQHSELPGYNPRWSPDGQWLSYVSPVNNGIQIYQLASGQSRLVPSRTGAAAAWSPDSQALVVTEVEPQGERFLTHLIKVEVDNQLMVNLSQAQDRPPGQYVEDSWAVWSPEGAWLAVGRKNLTDEVSPLGNQIWLMHPDGSEARQLTNSSQILYKEPVWSPDGQYLLFPRYELSGTGQKEPAIWLLNIATTEQQELVEQGSHPIWLTP